MIGIFDSGIGGLTVARAVETLLPNSSFLYFGDTARTPYGTKSPDVIIDYSLRNAEFLLANGAKLIVIGCNSASSVATQRLREEFDVPVLEVIGPAAAKAVAVSPSGRIGVIGTRATIGSTIYDQTIATLRPGCKIYSVACPLLVPLVEEGWTTRQETKMIIRRYLHPLKDKQIDTLILGCTHYPLLKSLIRKRCGKNVTLIDSSIEAASALGEQIKEFPELQSATKPVQHKIYLSDITQAAHRIAKTIFGRPVELLSP